jgi:hypothetical protein
MVGHSPIREAGLQIPVGRRPLPIAVRGGRLGLIKSGVVEGEPGIFPDPIARLLRAIGRLVTTRRGEATKPTQDPEGDETTQNGAHPTP